MNKVLVGILAIIVCVGVCLVASYNGLVSLDHGVKSAWAQVESQYQRRMDLLPNLVEIAKRYATHESAIFKDLAEARSRYAGAAPASADKINAANQMDGLLSRLMVVVENYPDLKANQEFTKLMDQWEGTENRISVERMRFNEKVQAYNSTARRFPGMLWAGKHGLDLSKPYFEAEKGAEHAPSAKEVFEQ